MALYERIIGINVTDTVPKLPVHQLSAAMHEFFRGRITAAQAATAFGLDAGELAELSTLATRITSGPIGNRLTAEEIEQVCELAEAGYFYGAVASLKTRLGV